MLGVEVDLQFLQQLRRAPSSEPVFLVQVTDLLRQLSDAAAQLVVPAGNASSQQETTPAQTSSILCPILSVKKHEKESESGGAKDTPHNSYFNQSRVT